MMQKVRQKASMYIPNFIVTTGGFLSGSKLDAAFSLLRAIRKNVLCEGRRIVFGQIFICLDWCFSLDWCAPQMNPVFTQERLSIPGWFYDSSSYGSFSAVLLLFFVVFLSRWNVLVALRKNTTCLLGKVSLGESTFSKTFWRISIGYHNYFHQS